MTYHRPNMLINFGRYFIIIVILHAIFVAVFQSGRTNSSSLLPPFVFACVMTYINRPTEKLWYVRNKDALISSMKSALINRYDAADQTENYIYFRPASFWMLIADPVFLEIKADQVIAKGANATISGLENQMRKLGVI